jgi:hypothetical protein
MRAGFPPKREEHLRKSALNSGYCGTRRFREPINLSMIQDRVHYQYLEMTDLAHVRVLPSFVKG